MSDKKPDTLNTPQTGERFRLTTEDGKWTIVCFIDDKSDLPWPRIAIKWNGEGATDGQGLRCCIQLASELSEARDQRIPNTEAALMRLLVEWHENQATMADAAEAMESLKWHEERVQQIARFFVNDLKVRYWDLGLNEAPRRGPGYDPAIDDLRLSGLKPSGEVP